MVKRGLIIYILLAAAALPAFCQSPAGVWLSYADRFFTAKEYEKALAGYDKVLSVDPGSYTATMRKGLCLYYLGRYGEAVEMLEKADALKPDPKVTRFIARLKKESAASRPGPSRSAGGRARTEALAGAAAQFIDPAVGSDMYAERFTSGYVFRSPSNYAGTSFSYGGSEESFYMAAVPIGNTVTSSSISFDTSDERPADNARWFSTDSVLLYSPYFSRTSSASVFVNQPLSDYNLSDCTGNFSLEYAHRLGAGFSLGAVAQYFKHSLYYIYEESQSYDTVSFDRLSYMLSATWSVPLGTNTLYFSAAAGSRRPHSTPSYFTVPDTLYEGVIVEGSSHSQVYHDDGAGADVDFDREISVNSYDAWLGTGYSNPGFFDLTAKFFCTPYTKITEKYNHVVHVFSPAMDITLADYDRTISEDLKRLGFDVNGAVYLPWACLGSGFYSDNFFGKNELYIGNTMNSHGTRVELYASAAVGWPKGFTFPVEVRYHAEENVDVRDDITYFYASETFEYAGGAEYAFDSGLSLRAGIRYKYGGMVQDSGPREFSARKDLTYGSPENPATASAGFYAGAGYLLGDWQFGLAAGTQRVEQKPLSSNLNAYSNGSSFVLLDVKYNFPSGGGQKDK